MPITNVISKWVSGNLSFQERVIGNDAQVHFGVDSDGLDVKWFGATASAYLLCDESADQLVTSGAAYIGGRTDTNGIGLAAGLKTSGNAPGTTGAVTGSIVFNTNDDKIYCFDGSAWKASAALT